MYFSFESTESLDDLQLVLDCCFDFKCFLSRVMKSERSVFSLSTDPKVFRKTGILGPISPYCRIESKDFLASDILSKFLP